MISTPKCNHSVWLKALSAYQDFCFAFWFSVQASAS